MDQRNKFEFIKMFEQSVTAVLISLMILVITLALLEIAWLIIKDSITQPFALFEIDEMLKMFAMFLVVLIGIELLETLKMAHQRNSVQAEMIILVALIALSRKVITLDAKEIPPLTLLGIAALIIALGTAYHILRRSHS